MIVKILSSAASFQGVTYNTEKIDKGKGELMRISGFGPLQALGKLKPEDYKNYLKLISAQNKRVSAPQFHVVISAKGRTSSKNELTTIAEKWLSAMGYGDQPYLIVFHNDTDNMHVHTVTTRIGKDGKKINSGFERIRAVQALNKIIGKDDKLQFEDDLSNALLYNFKTKAQFLMVMESRGYAIRHHADKLEFIKFGVKQGEVLMTGIEKKIATGHMNLNRQAQLKAIFRKYARSLDTAFSPKYNGFTSEFSTYLKEKMGIVLVFHAKNGLTPYGYSVIDHAQKIVFKGSEIMPLRELLLTKVENERVPKYGTMHPAEPGDQTKAYYAAILKAALHHYPDLHQGLYHQGLAITRRGDELFMHDPGTPWPIPANELLTGEDYNELKYQYTNLTEIPADTGRYSGFVPGISIADDVDDEYIHGRNRRRKRQARTNTR